MLGVTLVGAVQAVRGVIWFALAAAAILPVALDGLLTRADVAAPTVNRIISLAALAGLAVALVVTLVRPASWFASEWPEDRSRQCGQRPATPGTRLWATDGTADWLLWRIPDLRGRIAYDVRFELYDEPALDDLVAYGKRTATGSGRRRLRRRRRRRPGAPRRADRPRAGAVVPRLHDRRPDPTGLGLAPPAAGVAGESSGPSTRTSRSAPRGARATSCPTTGVRHVTRA